MRVCSNRHLIFAHIYILPVRSGLRSVLIDLGRPHEILQFYTVDLIVLMNLLTGEVYLLYKFLSTYT